MTSNIADLLMNPYFYFLKDLCFFIHLSLEHFYSSFSPLLGIQILATFTLKKFQAFFTFKSLSKSDQLISLPKYIKACTCEIKGHNYERAFALI